MSDSTEGNNSGIYARNQYDNHADNIKTINEFLIDIIGVLVPGGIFIFSISISLVIPIILICFTGMAGAVAGNQARGLLASNVFQGWFWLVLFFTFLILSYAIGNIFYRLDIKELDRLSFRRQQKKHYKDKIGRVIDVDKGKMFFCRSFFKRIKKEKSGDFLREYYELLFYHSKEGTGYRVGDKQNWMRQFEEFESLWRPKPGETAEQEQERINDFIDKLNKVAFSFYQKKFLEPEKVKEMIRGDSSPDTTDDQLIVAGKLLLPFIKFKGENKSQYLALCWFFLFWLRSEVACDNENDCQFPYEYYDTYLIKRNELALVRHATWCKDKDSRTKNAINAYKLKIQLKSKEAYNILIKNEAHIRMASSSYRVARTMLLIASIAMFIPPALLLPPSGATPLWELCKYMFVFICMPLSILCLNAFIWYSVIEFVHYQRLREIFFVLQVFDEIGGAGTRSQQQPVAQLARIDH